MVTITFYHILSHPITSYHILSHYHIPITLPHSYHTITFLSRDIITFFLPLSYVRTYGTHELTMVVSVVQRSVELQSAVKSFMGSPLLENSLGDGRRHAKFDSHPSWTYCRSSTIADKNIVPLLALLNVVAVSVLVLKDTEFFQRGLITLNIAFVEMGIRMTTPVEERRRII